MKIPMQRLGSSLIVLVALSSGTKAQTLPVDWLLPAERVDDRFLLVDDSSQTLGDAELSALVGFPLESGVAESYEGFQWLDQSIVPTNTDDTQTVDGFRVRVAPFGGVPDWSLNINAAESGDWYLAVGSLYRDMSVSHGPLQITASQNGTQLPLEFLGSSGWNGGAGSFQGALDWNGVANELSPAAGNMGESGMAFFRIRNFGGSDAKIVIDVPLGFSAGAAGDDVFFGLGRASLVPEPSSALLLLVPSLFFLGRRKRSLNEGLSM